MDLEKLKNICYGLGKTIIQQGIIVRNNLWRRNNILIFLDGHTRLRAN